MEKLEFEISFAKDFRARFDELNFMLSIINIKKSGIALDVGAHHGHTSISLAMHGYKCFSFEPDPINREILKRKCAGYPITIDERAISHKSCLSNFYKSPESSGVSSLSPFTTSHKKFCSVKTTTIKEVCKNYDIKHIDFLKIDAEGYDLMVLLGIPWNYIKPDAILCEFEDKKTLQLGYNYHTIASFLSDIGYNVFISEWHPIIRYGLTHYWNTFKKYPCDIKNMNAWGNIIALKELPSKQNIYENIIKNIKLSNEGEDKQQKNCKVTEKTNKKAEDINYKKITAFKNIHKSKRCFIVGNGPSLNKMDLSFLKYEYSFGLNRIYLLFDQIKFETTYYVSVNKLVLQQSHKDILNINCPKFISHKGAPYFPNPPENMVFIKSTPEWIFSTEPLNGLCEGWTVTYFTMQIAYYMGFDEVILIGVDHNFATKGKPNLEITSEGPDQNHFSTEYFGKGFKWNLPDLQRSEESYKIAKKAYEDAGKVILDATVDGKLTIFEKIDYKKLIR
ncbi:FkbM family methyltransferase [Desulfomicrobium salsuginis]